MAGTATEQSAFQGREGGEQSARPFFNSLDDRFTISTFLFEWVTQTFWPLNAPVVWFFDFSLQSEQLMLSFSETVDSETLDVSQLQLMDLYISALTITSSGR